MHNLELIISSIDHLNNKCIAVCNTIRDLSKLILILNWFPALRKEPSVILLLSASALTLYDL